jgi:hypothetical protein
MFGLFMSQMLPKLEVMSQMFRFYIFFTETGMGLGKLGSKMGSGYVDIRKQTNTGGNSTETDRNQKL